MATTLARKNEEAEIRDWLDSLNLPGTIIEYRLLLDNDWQGEPKVVIYFILSDSLMTDEGKTDKAFQEESGRIHQKVLNSFFERGLNRWPFPHFRFKSEQDALDEEERKDQQRIEKHRRS